MQTNTPPSKVLPGVVSVIEVIEYDSTSLLPHWDARCDANRGDRGLFEWSLLWNLHHMTSGGLSVRSQEAPGMFAAPYSRHPSDAWAPHPALALALTCWWGSYRCPELVQQKGASLAVPFHIHSYLGTLIAKKFTWFSPKCAEGVKKKKNINKKWRDEELEQLALQTHSQKNKYRKSAANTGNDKRSQRA